MKRLNRKKNRILLSLLGLLLALSLCACAEIKIEPSSSKDVFIRIGDATCSRAEAVFLLMEEKALYEEGQDPATLWIRPIGSETMNDYVKDVVQDKLTRYTAALVMSDKLAAYPTEKEKEKAGEDAVTAWTKISGRYDTDVYDISAEDSSELYEKKAIYEAVYRKITEDAASEITEDSTRVMEADYVLLPNSAGEAKARELWKGVKEGGDFSALCKAAGYELLSSQVIKRGELNSNVDQIAFALNDGELSEVIESKDGFYIIRCVDDKLIAESAANYNEIVTKAKEEAFKTAYYDFSKEAKISVDERFWKKIEIGSIR